jgi:hypothetical protein
MHPVLDADAADLASQFDSAAGIEKRPAVDLIHT